MKCIDCGTEDENHKAWYAEYTNTGRIMRCNSCGKKEEETRWKNLYGNRARPSSIEDLSSVGERIQYAKDLRTVNISPWRYRQEVIDE